MPDKSRIRRTWLSNLGYAVLSGWIALPLGAVGFAPAVDVTVGANPLGVGIADFDGDGLDDLAVTAHEDDELVVFRNTGSPGTLSFAAGLDLPSGLHPQGVAVADLDDDGRAEIVTANSGRGGGGTVFIHPNTSTPGTISFATAVSYPVDTAHRVAVGDLDGDGKPDLVVSANSPKHLFVFRNDSTVGSPSFTDVLHIGTSSFPNSLAVGDVDGDGKADVLATMGDGNAVSIYLNQSTPGSFAFAASADFATEDTPDGVVVAHFDDDELLDVVVANAFSDSVSLFLNTSTPGSLSFQPRVDVTVGVAPRDPAVGDLDGDHRPDVAVISTDDTLTVLESVSDPSGVTLQVVATPATGETPALPAIGDLDGDGAPDLAVANHDGTTASLFRSTNPGATAADHLLLCEVALAPTAGEFIEVVNPTDQTISLDPYYLADDDDYALLPEAFEAGPGPDILASDFIVQFPAGASIPPDGVVVVALDGAGFTTTYGFPADFEVHGTDPATPDMVAVDVGGAAAGLTDPGEHAVLFFWDGTTDLVSDVDMVNVGTPSTANAIGNKTTLSVDGPDADAVASTYLPDGSTMPQASSDPGAGESAKRVLLEGSAESPAEGNGLTGHDETSEDILLTWDSEYDDYVPPNPGYCCLTHECYYSPADPTDQTTLRATLHPVIDDHHRLSYDEIWDLLELAQEDPSDPGQVIDLYKNAPYPKDRLEYEREHSWPSSYGFPNDGTTNYPFTDAHHLYLADGSYNGSRSNKPYRDCDSLCDEKPTDAYDGRGGGTGTYPGNSNWTEGALTAGTWETWIGRRGDVARSLFYMDLRYEGGTHGTSGAPEPNLHLTDDETAIADSNTGTNLASGSMGILSELLQWHEEDPVDDRERLKNDLVHLFQRNRNPFIDQPEWVPCIYQDVCPGVDLAITKDDGWVEVLPGETVTYTLEVTNLGPDDATDAAVTDALDPATLDTASATWTCAPAPGADPATTCPTSGTAPDLAAGVPVSIEAGDTLVFTLEAQVLASASGTLVNTAQVDPPAGIFERAPASNTSTDTDEILETGACGHPEERTLTHRPIDGVEEFVACVSIFAGEGVEVVASGELTLRAGERVVLGDGFRVEGGGTLAVVIDGALGLE